MQANFILCFVLFFLNRSSTVVDHFEVVVVRLVPVEKSRDKVRDKEGERERGMCVVGLVSAISFLIQLLHHLCRPVFVRPCDIPLTGVSFN